jgi:hypothetical protein
MKLVKKSENWKDFLEKGSIQKIYKLFSKDPGELREM